MPHIELKAPKFPEHLRKSDSDNILLYMTQKNANEGWYLQKARGHGGHDFLIKYYFAYGKDTALEWWSFYCRNL